MAKDSLTKIETAAIELHTILWRGVGENADWPITISCSEDLQKKLCDALDALRIAIKEVRPDLVEWPIKLER